jgi:hypothetical protein
LRDIDHDHMSLLVANPGTWGDNVYFYHFAPRYLELATLPGGAAIEMFSRMFSIWLYGPQNGRAAIDVFVWAWWHQAASLPPDGSRYGAGDLLTVFGLCDRRVDAYLAAWPVGVQADLQLATTIRDLYQTTESDSQFWRDVNAWLYGPVPLARLTAAVAAAPSNGLGVDEIELLTATRDHHLGGLEWRASHAT